MFPRLLLAAILAWPGLLSGSISADADSRAPATDEPGGHQRFANIDANALTTQGIIPPAQYHMAAGDWISLHFDSQVQPGPSDFGPLQISPAGMIVLPKLGTQHLAGLTLAEAESALAQVFAKSDNPAGPVTLALGAPQPTAPPGHFEVTVVGEVETPGKYWLPLDTPKTVLDLLTVAKPNFLAILRAVKLRRTDNEGETTTIVINFAAKTEGRFSDPNVDLQLQPKDTMMIEECFCLE